MVPTLSNYLLVSGVLFALGFAGVLLKRNLLIIFMGLGLMLNAANLSLVAFSRFNLSVGDMPAYNAQTLVFFIITVAAAGSRWGWPSSSRFSARNRPSTSRTWTASSSSIGDPLIPLG